MRKTFKLEDIDCANCATKMEDGIRKLDGVNDVKIDFMRQTLILEVEEKDLKDVLAKAKKIIRKIEPDACLLV